MKKYMPLDILLAKEERVDFQNKLIKEYELPLISLRVNYPGVDKDNELSRKIGEVMTIEIKSKLKSYIVYEDFENTAEGPVLTLIVNNIAEEIKKITLDIEESHILGRCVDIDVYDKFGRGISRTKLGYKPRKCFLCEDYAKNCSRSRKHDIEDIIDFIKGRYNIFTHNSDNRI